MRGPSVHDSGEIEMDRALASMRCACVVCVPATNERL